VVGQRIHKRDNAGDSSDSPPLQGTDINSGDSTETEDSFEPLMEREDKIALSCTEIYLIAAKKDSTLVDVKGKFEKTKPAYDVIIIRSDSKLPACRRP
jgi:hypothetical protein